MCAWLALCAVGVRGKVSTALDVNVCRGNGALYPVLKHGPRSLTRMRVRRWQTSVRNESDDWIVLRHGGQAPSTDLCDTSHGFE